MTASASRDGGLIRTSTAVVLAVLVLASGCGGGGGAGGEAADRGGGGGNYRSDVRFAADVVWKASDLVSTPGDPASFRQELEPTAEQVNEAVARLEQAQGVPTNALDANQKLLSAFWFTRDALEDARLMVGDQPNRLPKDELDRAAQGLSDAELALKEFEKLGYDVRKGGG